MRYLWCLLMSVLIGAPAHGYEETLKIPETPDLRVVLGPEQAMETNGYIHGQLVLRVQLVSRHPFEALDLKLPTPDGTDVIELMRPRTRKVTSYAGQGYVFETSIAIFPQTSGVLTIPPVTAVGSVEPEKDKSLAFDLQSQPFDVKVAGVSPHFDDPWWLVAHRVEMDEAWSTPVTEVRVGEIVQRTVTLRAWGVPAEHLPELEHGRTRGIQVSPTHAPRLRTEKTPDGLIATAEYVWNLNADPQQVAFIAPVGVAYWDPQQHRRIKAAVPGHRLEPLPADSVAIAASLMAEAEATRDARMLVAWIVGALALAPALCLIGAYGIAVLPSRADLRLRSACRDPATPEQVYTALDVWLSASEWTPPDFEQKTDVRRRLSAHLFAPAHPGPATAGTVVSAAWAYARSARASAVTQWLSTWQLLTGAHINQNSDLSEV